MERYSKRLKDSRRVRRVMRRIRETDSGPSNELYYKLSNHHHPLARINTPSFHMDEGNSLDKLSDQRNVATRVFGRQFNQRIPNTLSNDVPHSKPHTVSRRGFAKNEPGSENKLFDSNIQEAPSFLPPISSSDRTNRVTNELYNSGLSSPPTNPMMRTAKEQESPFKSGESESTSMHSKTPAVNEVSETDGAKISREFMYRNDPIVSSHKQLSGAEESPSRDLAQDGNLGSFRRSGFVSSIFVFIICLLIYKCFKSRPFRRKCLLYLPKKLITPSRETSREAAVRVTRLDQSSIKAKETSCSSTNSNEASNRSNGNDPTENFRTNSQSETRDCIANCPPVNTGTIQHEAVNLQKAEIVEPPLRDSIVRVKQRFAKTDYSRVTRKTRVDLISTKLADKFDIEASGKAYDDPSWSGKTPLFQISCQVNWFIDLFTKFKKVINRENRVATSRDNVLGHGNHPEHQPRAKLTDDESQKINHPVEQDNQLSVTAITCSLEHGQEETPPSLEKADTIQASDQLDSENGPSETSPNTKPVPEITHGTRRQSQEGHRYDLDICGCSSARGMIEIRSSSQMGHRPHCPTILHDHGVGEVTISPQRPSYSASPPNLTHLDNTEVQKRATHLQIESGPLHHSADPCWESSIGPRCVTSVPNQYGSGPFHSRLLPSARLNRTMSQTSYRHERSRHHYENYYDDENEDAYRRLTASIGMQLGIEFNPHQSHANHLPSSVKLPSYGSPSPQFSPDHENCAANVKNDCVSEQGDNFMRCCGFNNERWSNRSFPQPEVDTPSSLLKEECIDRIHGPYQAYDASSSGLGMNNIGIERTGVIGGDSCSSAFRRKMTPECTLRDGQRTGQILAETSPNNYDISPTNCIETVDCSICQSNSLVMRQDEPSTSHPLATNQMCAKTCQNPMNILVHRPSSTAPSPQFSCIQDNKSGPDGYRMTYVRADDQYELSRRQSSKPSPPPITPPMETRSMVRANIDRATFDSNSIRFNDLMRTEQHARMSRDPNRCSPHHLNSFQRRMSVAGDQFRRNALSGTSNRQSALNLPLSQQHLLEHRASIASDGTNIWNQIQQYNQRILCGKQNLCRQKQNTAACPPKASCGNNFSVPSESSVTTPLSSGVQPGQGPVDSMFMFHENELRSSKSNYSSSSGIGFSGSQCTNTPTTSVFPYGSFMTNASELVLSNDRTMPFHNEPRPVGDGTMHDIDDDSYRLNLRDIQLADIGVDYNLDLSLPRQPMGTLNNNLRRLLNERYNSGSNNLFSDMLSLENDSSVEQLNSNSNNYEATNNPTRSHWQDVQQDETCLASSSQSRKYSLPVHLESKTTDRHNLPISDTSRSIRHPTLLTQDANQLYLRDTKYAPSEQVMNSYGLSKRSQHQQACDQSLCNSTLSDCSRRSSQTVVRQSSFWLEDPNTDDSLISSTTSMVKQNSANVLTASTQKSLPNTDGHIQHQEIGLALKLSDNDQEHSRQEVIAPEYTPDVEPGNSVSSTKAVDGDSQAPRGFPPRSPLSPNAGETDFPRPERPLQASPETTSSSRASDSTSTSSPSPDSSKPGERILVSTRFTRNISKRSVFSRSRLRRLQLQRLADGVNRSYRAKSSMISRRSCVALQLTRQHNSEPGPRTRDLNETSEGNIHSVERPQSNIVFRRERKVINEPVANNACGEREDELPAIDTDFRNRLISGPISDRNSASLERQCRELWKLRATLHSDASVGDNWTNYHQRLNRRYDSGYKSIENQFSSSIEGSTVTMAAPAANAKNVREQPSEEVSIDVEKTGDLLEGSAKAQARAPESNLETRPQSGCSGYINNNQRYEIDTGTNLTVLAENENTGEELDEDISLCQLNENPIDMATNKLANFELDDNPMDLLVGEHTEKSECHSRSSSKSSNGRNNDEDI